MYIIKVRGKIWLQLGSRVGSRCCAKQRTHGGRRRRGARFGR
jgi:hypothetical protein